MSSRTGLEPLKRLRDLVKQFPFETVHYDLETEKIPGPVDDNWDRAAQQATDNNSPLIVPGRPAHIHMFSICCETVEEESEVYVCVTPAQQKLGFEILAKAKTIVAHNGICFDHDVIKEIAGYKPAKGQKELDTLLLSRTLFNEYRGHGIKDWGKRFDMAKGDYTDHVEEYEAERVVKNPDYIPLDPWSRGAMKRYQKQAIAYCRRDTFVMSLILRSVKAQEHYHDDINVLENRLQRLMWLSQQHGIPVNIHKLNDIKSSIETQMKITAEALKGIKPFIYPKAWEFKKNNYNPPKYNILTREQKENRGYPSNPPLNYTNEFTAASVTATRCYTNRNNGDKNHFWKYKEVKNRKTGEIALDRSKKVPWTHEDGNKLFPAHTPIVIEPFDAGSPVHLIKYLLPLGWHPAAFSDKTNRPKTGVKELEPLKSFIPQATHIIDHLVCRKQYSDIFNGKKSVCNIYNPDTGRYHHLNMVRGAARSSRSSHSPNLSQTTRASFDYHKDAPPTPQLGLKGKWGCEMRGMFGPYPGHVQVGVDLDGLELATLAEMMSPYDNGALIETITKGSKKDGTDIHSRNRDSVVAAIKDSELKQFMEQDTRTTDANTKLEYDRDSSKKSVYTMMYGGGFLKIGHDAAPFLESGDKMILGKLIKFAMMDSMKGIEDLIKHHSGTVKRGDYVEIDIDGSRFFCDSDHIILSRINQSTGARVASHWIMDGWDAVNRYGEEQGLVAWKDYGFMLYSHDECQYSVRPDHAEAIKNILIAEAPIVGKKLGFTMPIAAEGKVGKDWLSCH